MSPGPFRKLPPDDLRPDQVEAAIAHLPFERAYLFDALWRQVCQFEGTADHLLLDLTAAEIPRIRGGSLIHNHPPNTDFRPDDQRYDNASLSDLDLLWAAEHDLATIIAVSPTWRHTMSRPIAGWYAEFASPGEFEDALRLLYPFVEARLARRVVLGEMSDAELRATLSHVVNEQFSRETGAIYRKERR